jgi:DNA-binding IclR family transcriptional regulator
MLEALLRQLARGGLQSYHDLAAALSVPEPLLEAMLENLARLGYLQRVEGCNRSCHGCSSGSCSVQGQGRIWSLTERGLRAADREADRTAQIL